MQPTHDLTVVSTMSVSTTTTARAQQQMDASHATNSLMSSLPENDYLQAAAGQAASGEDSMDGWLDSALKTNTTNAEDSAEDDENMEDWLDNVITGQS